MGCAASATPITARLPPDFDRMALVLPAPAWEPRLVADLRQVPEDSKTGPSYYRQLHVITADDRLDVAKASCQRLLSSWDSAAWEDVPEGVPLPPNRRLHEKHVKQMQAFLQDVRTAPRVLVKSIRIRRATARSGADVLNKGRLEQISRCG